MDRAVVYIHGKGGSAAEAEHYKPLFPDCDVIGFDYSAQTPWEAKEEFAAFADPLCKRYGSVTLIANSIGAYFAMHALAGRRIERAFLISPVVDMERLISDMMTWAGVTEDELRERREIPTEMGETLSWDYWCYAKNHPIAWDIPTHILYGEKDALIAFESVSAFAQNTNAALTVMEGGEHWFHTEAQMAFWMRGSRGLNDPSILRKCGAEDGVCTEGTL